MQDNFSVFSNNEKEQITVAEGESVLVDERKKNLFKIALVISVCFLIIVVVFVFYYFISTKKQSQDKNNVRDEADVLPRVTYDVRSTKLLDLSEYDVEKSKKLWSEESFFIFDKRGYLVQVPLVKKGMDQGRIISGHKNGRIWESGQYANISPNGKYLLYLQNEKSLTEINTGISVVYVVLIETDNGEILWKSPSIDEGKAEVKIKAMFFDEESHAHLFLEQDNKSVVWYKDGKNILTINDSDYLKQTTMLVEKDKLAVISNEGGTFKIIFNGSVIVPQWKYSDKPLACLLVGFLENDHVFYSCFNASMDVFFSNNDVVAEYNLKDFSEMVAGMEGEPVYSSDGKRMALVIKTKAGGKFVKVLGEEKKIFRKEYPENSIISHISFDSNSERLYYKVTTIQGDVKKIYAVVNEVEEGPYWSVEKFAWGPKSTYAYTAFSAIEEDSIVIVNGKTIKTIKNPQSILKHAVNTNYDYDDVKVENLDVMADGNVFFCVVKTYYSEAFRDSLKVANEKKSGLSNSPSFYSKEKSDPFEFRTTCNYDGKDTREYQGLLGGWNVSFSRDKKHIAYPVFSEKERILVLDGKEIPIDGDFLGSWSGDSYSFSDDGKWFGMYIMKDNGIWWIQYPTE